MERGVFADHLKGITLYRVEDIFEGYLRWRAKKFVAPLRSTHTLDDISLTEPLKDLLGVGEIDPLTFGDLSRAYRDLSVIFGEVKSA
jgi:hypothetical protein